MVLSKLIAAWTLMGVCVVIHAMGITWALRWLERLPGVPLPFWRSTWLFVRLAALIVLLHVLEITTWAVFLVWRHAMPDLHTAVYFSAATYTTTGYGDVTLPVPWQWLAGIEGLTGILMCGWSTGFFFATLARLHAPHAGIPRT